MDCWLFFGHICSFKDSSRWTIKIMKSASRCTSQLTCSCSRRTRLYQTNRSHRIQRFYQILASNENINNRWARNFKIIYFCKLYENIANYEQEISIQVLVSVYRLKLFSVNRHQSKKDSFTEHWRDVTNSWVVGNTAVRRRHQASSSYLSQSISSWSTDHSFVEYSGGINAQFQ